MHQAARSRALRLLTAGPVLLFLITVAFYWKLVLTDQYTWLESPDLAHQVLPWFQYQAGEWHAGRFPLWAPYEWGGQPLVGQAQPGAVYPPNWLLFLAPLRRGWIRMGALHWYFVLQHFLAVLFAYWLCRDLKRTKPAAIIGASVFAFGGYMASVDWPQMVNGALWAPLVFLFHLRAVRGEAPLCNAALCGLFLGVSWLSGHHQAPIFLSLAVGISWVWFLFRDRRLLPAVAVFGLIFILIGGMQILPAYEYGKFAKRWVGMTTDPIGWDQPAAYNVHQHFSYHPISVLGIAIPNLNQNTNGYIGAVALMLGALALGSAGASYWFILAAGALAVSLAGFTGLHGLLYSLVPMVEKARSPSMAIFVFNLAFCPLVAMGIDLICVTNRKQFVRATCIFGGALLIFYAGWGLTRGPTGIPDQRPILAGLTALAAGFLVARQESFRPLVLTSLIGALVLTDLGGTATWFYPNRFDQDRTFYLKKMAQDQDIAEFLSRQPQPVRIMHDEKAISYNFGDWYGIDTFGGYLASLTVNLLDSDHGSGRTRKMFGVTHWIGPAPLFEGQPVLFGGRSGNKVFAMPDPLPRTWMVHSVFLAPDRDATRALIQNAPFDLRSAAVLTGADPKLEVCGGDSTALVSHEPSRVVVDAQASCRGLLILGDTWYPGWQARVDGGSGDGREVDVREVNGVLRGVVLEKGRHRVVFEYRPAMFYAGAAMSGAGLLLALGFVFYGRGRPNSLE